MSDSNSSFRSNPLVPLILFLMLIILLTVIVSNLKPKTNETVFSMLDPIPELEQFSLDSGDSASGLSAYLTNEDQVIRKAARNFRIGKIDEAESDFRTILIFDPNNLAALSYLGTIFYMQGKYKDAEFMFRKKTECYPSQSIGFLNLGMTLFQLGDIDGAIQEIKRAVCLNSADTDSIILLARLYAYSGDRSNAAACLKRAKQSGVDLTEILKEKIFRNLYQESSSFSEILERDLP